MQQFKDLYTNILENGTHRGNRTKFGTISIPGAMLKFDLRAGFPLLGLRQMPWKMIRQEYCAFMRGETHAEAFRVNGKGFWDGNANENAQWLANPFREGTDDLGQIYGAQWRKWPAFKEVLPPNITNKGKAAEASGWKPYVDYEKGTCSGLYYKEIDQLRECYEKLIGNPNDRRILFHAWNPAQLDEMALPPCHLLYQFLPDADQGLLHMKVDIRSADTVFGTSANVAGAAMIQSLMASITGFTPAQLMVTTGDTHIYDNQVEMVKEMLTRENRPLPDLLLSDKFRHLDSADRWKAFDQVQMEDFELFGYDPHPPIKGVEMAV